MTVKILLFFTFYLMSVGGGASREVAGYPGGGVLIKCKYERSCTSNPKYFCKSSWTTCGDQIKTGVSNERKNTGRFSLFDNTRAAEFWVLIRDLTVEDSGTYQCAVDIEWNKDLYTPVELKIKEDLDQKKSITVNGHVGESVRASCKYPRSSSSKPRFLCRRVGSADCNYKASVKESRRWIKEGKFSLYDDRAQQTFTVSIDNLTNEDSGEYWCGAESDWESDHGYKVYITQIKLTVTAAVPHSTFSPSSVQTQPTHLPNFSAIAPRSVHPEPTHQLTNLLIYITGGLVIMVITLLVAMTAFYKHKKNAKKSKAPVEMTPLNIMPTNPRENISKSTEIPSADDCIYQEIDEQQGPAMESTVNTIYSTAEGPTDPSVYSTIDESTDNRILLSPP
ncbi:polymeric immunoglobulin receptor-like isoform X1 [Salminus brasiliensis]|uniref:polymeric immunoglobulin receptor-like isoform X1 n=1 Tax=Salminus brasiliensis TaxID=930266 RepID=UPI003B832A0B